MADESQAVEQEDQQADATGGDSAEGKAAQREERDAPAGNDGDGGGESGDGDNEAKKAQEKEEEREKARETVKEMEEGEPPADLEDWPDDAAKYETFGGPEGDHGYHEGPEEKLGPSSLRHKEDGGVTIAGEEVDDADEYKSDPIPGGPTDPDAKQDLTAKKIQEDQGRDGPDSGDGNNSGSDGDSNGDDDSGDS